jgi:uncharacterized protein (TIGR02466 family)
MMNELYPLFSQPVLTVDSEKSKLLDLVKYCENMLEYRPNAGGNFTSLNTDVLNLKEFSEAREIISSAIDVYTREIMAWDDPNLNFFITQSWVNKNPKGSSHHEHYHLNAVFSGVFYLQTIENDSISFVNNVKPFFKFYPSESNMWNCERFNISAKDNRVVIFPSGMLHSVPAHQSEQNRISLAFNVFVKGKIGSKENLTYVEY